METHLRVVPSGVWRRAFVRSCVSLLVTEAAQFEARAAYTALPSTRDIMLSGMRSQRAARYSFACLCRCTASYQLATLQRGLPSQIAVIISPASFLVFLVMPP